MTRKIILYVVAALVLSAISYNAGYIIALKERTIRVEQKQWYDELVDTQDATIRKAEKIMDNNNLWDTDGSDDMQDYMDLCKKVDSLWIEAI